MTTEQLDSNLKTALDKIVQDWRSALAYWEQEQERVPLPFAAGSIKTAKRHIRDIECLLEHQRSAADGNANGGEQGYQGWPNWETWVVHLHIANAESLYRVARQTTEAEELKSWAEYRLIRLPTAPDGIEFDLLSNDLLTGSLQKVDWSRVHSAITEE